MPDSSQNIDPTLLQTVRDIATLLGDRTAFTTQAFAAAEHFGPEAIVQLKTLYHDDPMPPEECSGQFAALGSWLSARQFAIFEIYYHLGYAALPELRRVAFGEYDWTQGNALEILCRLAAAGIDQERILEEIKCATADFREEAIMYAMGPLVSYESTTPGLREVLTALRQDTNWDWAYHHALSALQEQQRNSLLRQAEFAHMKQKPWWKFW